MSNLKIMLVCLLQVAFPLILLKAFRASLVKCWKAYESISLVISIRANWRAEYYIKQKKKYISPPSHSEGKTNLQNAHSSFTFFQNSKAYFEYALFLRGSI